MQEPRGNYCFSYAFAFDDKGRISIPTEWRSEKHERSFYIIFSARNRCLRVYPESWMSGLQERVNQLKSSDPHYQGIMAVVREAQPAALDSQNRILISKKLRDQAGIAKEAELIGCLGHFEIWSPEHKPKSVDVLPDIDALEDAFKA